MCDVGELVVSPTVRVLDDEAQLAQRAAEAIELGAAEAIDRRGRFHWALAGGGTPKRTYRVLAGPPHRETFPWNRLDAWIGDERIVPGNDPASNRRMILEHLLWPAGADTSALHAFDTESGDPDAAARSYADQLAARVPGNADGVPVLDLVLLGLGTDAHTASWFPGSRFCAGETVAVVDEEHAGYRRLTLTPAIVNAARQVLFLVAGASKQDALRRVLLGPSDPLAIPAQRVAPTGGRLTWMLDRDAAGQFFAD